MTRAVPDTTSALRRSASGPGRCRVLIRLSRRRRTELVKLAASPAAVGATAWPRTRFASGTSRPPGPDRCSAPSRPPRSWRSRLTWPAVAVAVPRPGSDAATRECCGRGADANDDADDDASTDEAAWAVAAVVETRAVPTAAAAARRRANRRRRGDRRLLGRAKWASFGAMQDTLDPQVLRLADRGGHGGGECC